MHVYVQLYVFDSTLLQTSIEIRKSIHRFKNLVGKRFSGQNRTLKWRQT